MKVLVTSLYSGTETVFEGHPLLVVRQILVRFPFLGPQVFGEPVETVLEHINAQQGFEATILEDEAVAAPSGGSCP